MKERHFNEVVKLQSKHTGAHIYLAEMADDDETAFAEYQKAFAVKPLGKEWQKLKIVDAREQRPSGTFIVKASKAQLHLAETDEPGETLDKFDAFPFTERRENRVYFTDTTHPVVISDKGWLLESYRYAGRHRADRIAIPQWEKNSKKTRYEKIMIVKEPKLDWLKIALIT